MLPPFSLIFPAYNEEERIGQTLERALAYLMAEAPDSEVIVVNDGSTDRTSAVARAALARAKLKTQLLENFPNCGKGAAVRRGFLAAEKPIALYSDSDLSAPLEEMPKLIEPIERGELDLTFGSRALNRRLIGDHQPWRREQAGRIFNFIVRLSTGLPFWDTQCGFKAVRLDVCRPVIDAAKLDGFTFDVELLYLARKAGLRLREIPVRWNHSEGSKVHLVRDSLKMLREMAALRLGA